MLRITVGDFEFAARLEEEKAPDTVAALRGLPGSPGTSARVPCTTTSPCRTARVTSALESLVRQNSGANTCSPSAAVKLRTIVGWTGTTLFNAPGGTAACRDGVADAGAEEGVPAPDAGVAPPAGDDPVDRSALPAARCTVAAVSGTISTRL